MLARNVIISIIVPVCNAERYLKQCIESIVNQSFRAIEIICVNDGSKDDSLKILQNFAKTDSRIIIIDKENTGYGDSVNRGLDAASGEYIGIVESDDFIHPEMFECLYALSDGGLAEIVKGNFWDYYDCENGGGKSVTNNERKNIPENESFNIRQNPNILWGHPSVWSAIYKNDFLKQNNIKFQSAPGGGWVDNPFFFETCCLAKNIKWTSTPYYFYRKTNPASSSNKQVDLTLPLRRMLDNLDVIEKYNFVDEDILKFLYARALMYLCGLFSEKDFYKQIDVIRPYAQRLMGRLNWNVINDDFNEADQFTYYKYLSPLQTLFKPVGKVLIYNWIPFDNVNGIGGGVNVYCRNLISEILQLRPDIQVYFLSSGWAYDSSSSKTYIRKVDNIFGERCRTFEIVNSPVPAAQEKLLNNPSVAFKNEALKNIFVSFLSDYGKFNVIHFNNIEGISLDCLKLKEEFPDTKLIYSMHNYIPICVTGFYYQRQQGVVCSSHHTAKDCLRCTDVGRNQKVTESIIARANFVMSDNKRDTAEKWIRDIGLEKLDIVSDEHNLMEFCEKAKVAINSMDVVLAVSQRVKEIAVRNGIAEGKVVVSYIGTKIASHQINTAIAQESKYLRIAFLGTNINFEEKGYPFLLKSLSTMPEDAKRHIDLVLTTTSDCDGYIRNTLGDFHEIQIVHGYRHADLKNILKNVHLGLVPVLWEDNLPQIAIEMNAIGVPVLSSDAGGASELCLSEKFKFKNGDEEDFKKHILYFLSNPSELNEYWKYAKRLVTMREHWNEIEKIYSMPKTDHMAITLEQYSRLLLENNFLQRLAIENGTSSAQDPDGIMKRFLRYLRMYGLKKTAKRILQGRY